MIKQFNFYKSYMDNIASLSHAEAGQYIKKLLDFMFRDKEPDELPRFPVYNGQLTGGQQDIGRRGYARFI